MHAALVESTVDTTGLPFLSVGDNGIVPLFPVCIGGHEFRELLAPAAVTRGYWHPNLERLEFKLSSDDSCDEPWRSPPRQDCDTSAGLTMFFMAKAGHDEGSNRLTWGRRGSYTFMEWDRGTTRHKTRGED